MTELSDYQRLVEKPERERSANTIRILDARAGRLEKALGLALGYLEKNEPKDSRAVSPEFVAMAAVQSGNENTPCMEIIEAALALQADGQSATGEKP